LIKKYSKDKIALSKSIQLAVCIHSSTASGHNPLLGRARGCSPEAGFVKLPEKLLPAGDQHPGWMTVQNRTGFTQRARMIENLAFSPTSGHGKGQMRHPA
jgi:hypothetical protein